VLELWFGFANKNLHMNLPTYSSAKKELLYVSRKSFKRAVIWVCVCSSAKLKGFTVCVCAVFIWNGMWSFWSGSTLVVTHAHAGSMVPVLASVWLTYSWWLHMSVRNVLIDIIVVLCPASSLQPATRVRLATSVGCYCHICWNILRSVYSVVHC